MMIAFHLRRNGKLTAYLVTSLLVILSLAIVSGSASAVTATEPNPTSQQPSTTDQTNPNPTGDTTSQTSGFADDPVYLACKRQLSSKAEGACSRNNYINIIHARNTASYHCKDKPTANNQKAECIQDEAIHYIEQAANNMEQPETINHFEDSLNKILTKALEGTGGSVDTPSADAGVQTYTFATGNNTAKDHQCGSGEKSRVYTALNFGCKGEACINNPSDAYCQKEHNAIIDMLFALIRFLSNGAGLFIIGSLVLGGIQYTYARGDTQATTAALNRIRTTLISLLIFIFAYAILNYLIPGTFLQ